MLTNAVKTYMSVRQATGFDLEQVGRHLRCFAAYSDAKGQSYVNCQTAIERARQASSVEQRARRLGAVIRLARYLRAENARHEIPPAVFGGERRVRRPPHILSEEQIRRLVQLAAQSGYPTLRRQTYSTLFALLPCTGLRVSEAVRLRYDDITPDGLVIRATKFQKTRQARHETIRSDRQTASGRHAVAHPKLVQVRSTDRAKVAGRAISGRSSGPLAIGSAGVTGREDRPAI